MTPKPRVSIEHRVRIVVLAEEGHTSRYIATKVPCNQSTIVRILKKYETIGKVDDLPRSGRPRKTTVRDDRILKRMCLQNRHLTSPELLSSWKKHADIDVCPSTVRARLHSVGLKGRRARKKPLLTDFQRKRRLAWAKQHISWTPEQWNRVIFSDESHFCLHGNQGHSFVRRYSHEEFKPECLNHTVKHPLKIMVWGCISGVGVGRLELVSGMMNGSKYINVLEKKMLPSAAAMFPDADFMFQDDNAPCHRSKIVEEWFASKQVTRISWPGQSPDLNPIENLWHKIGYEVSKKKPTNKAQLIEGIIHAWNHIVSPELLKNLVDSMPSRCQAVVKSKGWPTKY